MTATSDSIPELLTKLHGAERLFQQPVPPSLVRRTNASDVFVTNLRVIGFDTFEVSARLPGSHTFYGPSGGTHDTLLLLETARQAGLLVSHVVYDIPRKFKFITNDKQFHTTPGGLRTAAGDEPVDLVLTLTSHDIKRRGRRVGGMRTEVACRRDGELIGTATYRWSCVSDAAYVKLRGEYKDAVPPSREGAAVVRPELVGRTREVDVLLAETATGRGWELCVDPAHDVIYDHVIDHVPGNAVVEAARQAALLAVGRPDAVPVSGEFAFAHYLEFDAPCLVSAEVVGETADGSVGVRFVLEQKGRSAVDGVMQLTLP
jgi:hypothetical protein